MKKRTGNSCWEDAWDEIFKTVNGNGTHLLSLNNVVCVLQTALSVSIIMFCIKFKLL